ncbi:hypothetical protein BDZ97DRAFT_1911665 [Flammula alnicola]|nr:hypothetical protein BDZ97DRAFT_1911665 [Flammula alnicola]
MEVDKVENEIDELEDDEFASDYEHDTEIYDTALNPNVAKILTTHELHSMIHEGNIELNPVYQRDVVWPETKQIGLIDSIFRNFFIPPVIFAVHVNDEGEEVRICVDGKQRLTSIQKFFDGLIPHRNTKTKKNFWYTMSESTKGAKTELPAEFKTIFKQKQITVVEYHGLAPGSEREIFQRVQLGMSLTAAEKLQAIASPWAEWIAHLEEKHVAIEDGLAEKLAWDISRGRDFQNIAHMVFCCDGLPDELLPTAQKIEKWISRVDKPPAQFQEDMETVLRTLWVIASNSKYNEGFIKIPQRVAPVEFIFIGVLLYVLRNQPRETQARAVYILRSTIRQEFKDIRNNSIVGKALWKHIGQLRHRPTTWLTSEEASKVKRKRNSGLEDDDDEFHPQPIRAIGKPVKTRAKKSKSG